jgi:hypothetical protein
MDDEHKKLYFWIHALLCAILVILLAFGYNLSDIYDKLPDYKTEKNQNSVEKNSVEKKLCAKYCWQDDYHVSINSARYTFSYYCAVN